PEGPEFNITLQSPRGRETLDTREIRQALKDVPLNSPEVIAWIIQATQDRTQEIFGGELT
ncbi:MAG: hypothetical protein PHP02_08910, partial [Eubacteriales bacterium]|nr:hypothetical protein [Eubacteriales bacterium]